MAMDDQSVGTLCERALGGTSVVLERPRKVSDLLQIAQCFAGASKGAVLLVKNSALDPAERERVAAAGAGRVFFGE